MNRKTKSFVKGLTWEVSVFFVLTIVTMFVFKTTLGHSIMFNLLVTIFKVIGLSVFDYMWEKNE